MKCAREGCDKPTKKVGGVPRVFCSKECAKFGNGFAKYGGKK